MAETKEAASGRRNDADEPADDTDGSPGSVADLLRRLRDAAAAHDRD